MVRAYSQDLRDHTIKTALDGVSVRRAAARKQRIVNFQGIRQAGLTVKSAFTCVM